MLKDNPYAIVVNASTRSGCNDGYNYGQSSTDVFAPGVDILSTASTRAPEGEQGSATYKAETDRNPVVKDFFNDDTGSVEVYQTCNDQFELADAIPRQRSSEFFYEGETALQLNSSNFTYEGESKTLPGVNFYDSSCYLRLPVEDGADVKYLNAKALLQTDKLTSGYYAISVAVKDGDEVKWDNRFEIKHIIIGNQWINLSYTFQEGSLPYLDNANCMLVKFTKMGKSENWTETNETIYLDCLAAGNETPRYLVMSGTSMAAPVVTGAAAIAAREQELADIDMNTLSEDRRSQLAKERIVWLKAHVTQNDNVLSLCSTGGILDLSVQNDKVLPVITHAAASNETGEIQISVTGSGFGNTGTILIDDQTWSTDNIVSWSDTQINVLAGADLKSGVHSITVETANGSCSEGFLLEVNSPEDRVVFEKDIELPFEITEYSMDNTLVGLGGAVYVFPQSQYQANYQSSTLEHTETYNMGSYLELWCYNPKTDSWKQCSNLPDQVEALSATTYQGELLITGSKITQSSQIEKTILCTYDPTKDQWEELKIASVPGCASIANTGEDIIVVGGAQDNLLTLVSENNIQVLDIQNQTLRPVGSLTTPRVSPQIVADKNIVYVMPVYEKSFADPSHATTIEKIEKVNQAYVHSNLTDAFQSVLLQRDIVGKYCDYGAVMTAEGLVVSGAIAYSDAELSHRIDVDTFLMKNGTEQFVDFGKSVSTAPIFHPNSLAYDGWLYTMASTTYDSDTVIFRATAVQTNELQEEATDHTKVPAQSLQKKSVDTGDETLCIGGFLLLMILSAATIYYSKCRRRE